MEKEVGNKLMAGGMMERGASFKFDPNKNFRKQRKQPTALQEEALTSSALNSSMFSATGDDPAQSLTSPGLIRTATSTQSPGGLVRAKTSIGFYDGREKGRLPPRLRYIHRVTFGSVETASGVSVAGELPEIQRPPEYQELAQLLKSVNEETNVRSASKTWISTKEGFRGSWPRARPPPPVQSRPTSRANSRPSSRGDSRPLSRSGSAQLGIMSRAENQARGKAKGSQVTVRRDEEVLEMQNPLKVYQPSPEAELYLPARIETPSLSRAGSANKVVSANQTGSRQGVPPSSGQTASTATPEMLPLRPIVKGKQAALDELDMHTIKTSGQSIAFPDIRKGETIDISKIGGETVHTSPSQSKLIERIQGRVDSIEVALPADSPEVRQRLGQYARGDARSIVPKVRLLPQSKNPVWNNEIKRIRRENDAAVWMQKSWRRYIRRKKYKLYIVHKASRSVQLQKSIMCVWLRVVRQVYVESACSGGRL